MRRADANVGDAVEVRDGKRWVKATIERIEFGVIHTKRPSEIHAYPHHPKDVRQPKVKARAERPRKSLRGVHVATKPDARSTVDVLVGMGFTAAEAEKAEKFAQETVDLVMRAKGKRGPALSRPKAPKPWRSEPYLALVRKHPCVFKSSSCYGPIEAHHHGKHPVGQKTDDSRAVPLCTGHHRDVTDDGYVADAVPSDGARPPARDTYRHYTTAAIAEVQVDLLCAWLRGER